MATCSLCNLLNNKSEHFIMIVRALHHENIMRRAVVFFGSSRKRLQRTTPCFSSFSSSSSVRDESLFQSLDGVGAMNNMPSTKKKKLERGLETKKRRPMDDYEVGVLETKASQILDILNDALDSKLTYGIFKHIPQTSKVVSFEQVKCSRDLTRVTVVWHSDLFLDFIRQASIRHGEHDAKRLERNIFKKTNSLLQAKESKFRTFLMRNMLFRRVPRISFVPPGIELSREEKYEKNMREWQREEALKLKIRKRWERDNNYGGSDRDN